MNGYRDPNRMHNAQVMRRAPRAPKIFVVTAALATAALLAGCASSGSGNSAHGPVNVVIFEPLTGPDAVFVGQDIAGVHAAADVINAAGPPLGRKINVQFANSYDDPADAVPATRRMLATTSDVIGIMGPTTNPGEAIAPILNSAKIPFFPDSGDVAFDTSHYQYLWRPTPSDSVLGYVLAAFAHKLGYTRVATLFGNNIGSSDEVTNAVTGTQKLGGTIVLKQNLALDQSSYNSEVSAMLAAHPQAILTETDPQTTNTYFTEMEQLNHGKLIPVIDDGYLSVITAARNSAIKAIGAATMAHNWRGVTQVGLNGGPGWKVYDAALKSLKGISGLSNPAQYFNDSYSQTYYDAVTDLALAMVASKSSDPRVLNSWILRLTAPHPGAVVVHTYAAGRAALQAGKSIQYIGVSGPQRYNKYHNNILPYVGVKILPNGQVSDFATVTQAEIASVDPTFAK
jgi:ABC-type branched-subunit amino acid transport system substrate-binding protein